MYGVSCTGAMYGVSSMDGTPGISIVYSTGVAAAPTGGSGIVTGPKLNVVGGGVQLATENASTPKTAIKPIRTRTAEPVRDFVLFIALPPSLTCIYRR